MWLRLKGDLGPKVNEQHFLSQYLPALLTWETGIQAGSDPLSP